MVSVENLKRLYMDWLDEHVQMNDLNGIVEITTPILDRHNDFLQLYVTAKGDSLIISDAGYIIGDLECSGMSVFSSPKRRDLFNLILNGYGVQCSDNHELYVTATRQTFAQKKHMLLQAAIAVGDMFMLSRTNVSSLFLEDVQKYFDDHDIFPVSNVSFVGKSGKNHHFDFVLSRTKTKPERYIRAINNPTRQGTDIILFTWLDTREARPNDSSLYVFLNDEDHIVSHDILTAYTNYDVVPMLWTQRSNYLSEFQAS